MIITLTPNPSIDATLALGEKLRPGFVQRADTVTRMAGGKGVNVAHAIYLAGEETIALFPCHDRDPFLSFIRKAGIPFHNISMDADVRTNTTLTEPGGQTTKVNGPGPKLSHAEQALILAELTTRVRSATWVVLSGSLPCGVPAQWYAELVRAVRLANPAARIAVDTSDAPMRELSARLPDAAPDLIKPNGLELGQLVGVDGLALERSAAEENYDDVIAAAREVNARGIPEVLVTLGGAGAALVTATGAWVATPPHVEVCSTVGAGDSSLAGYILARNRGEEFAAALAQSVSYGAAAAKLPGTTIPHPSQLNLAGIRVHAL